MAMTLGNEINKKSHICRSSQASHKTKQQAINFRKEKAQHDIAIDHYYQGSYCPHSSLQSRIELYEILLCLKLNGKGSKMPLYKHILAYKLYERERINYMQDKHVTV